jgi:ribose transport system substrate-binding protein
MRKHIVPLLALACATALAAACGSSGGAASPPAPGNTGAAAGAGSGANSVVAPAEAAVTKAYAGLYRQPAPGPAAQKGKTIYVITCGNLALGCYVPAQAIQDAAKTLGWTVKIVDGQLNPAGYTAGIRAAIAAKPDGIVTIGIDCTNAKSAYEQAKAANIPVVGVFDIDCNDPAVGGKQVMTAQIDMGTGQDIGKWFYNWGALHADYIIAKTAGKAKVIEFSQVGFLDISYIDKGFEAEMAKCTTCKIVEKQVITPTDVFQASLAQAKVSSAIIGHADANALYFDNDTLLGAAASVLKSNPHPGWVVAGSEGLPTTLSLVGTTVTSLTAFSSPWLGWCAAYSMNEVLAGKPVTDCGIGFEVVDKDHNRPAQGATTVTPNIDYQATMKAQWNS